MSWFKKVSEGLTKSSNKLVGAISGIFNKGQKIDAETLESLEEILIEADFGVNFSDSIIESIKQKAKESSEEIDIYETLSLEIEQRLEKHVGPIEVKRGDFPRVVMLLGINGSGKTTTAAKLAYKWQKEGKKVLLIAADTFRAAASQQLLEWAERIGVDIKRDDTQPDPSALVYGFLKDVENYDVVIVDTAGRLHTRADLMAELTKMKRVINKINPEAPHDVVLVLDASIGQNAHAQIEMFHKNVGLTGLIMTKLDGTAKGGVLVAIIDKWQLKVHYIGLGEGLDDLMEFDPRSFALGIVGRN